MFPTIFKALLALGALTLGTKPRKNAPPGNLKLAVLPVTFPAEYVQDEDLDPADFGFNRVEYGYAVLTSVGGGEVNVANVIYDYTNGKIRLFDETPGQVAAEAAIEAEEEPVTALVFAYGS